MVLNSRDPDTRKERRVLWTKSFHAVLMNIYHLTFQQQASYYKYGESI